MNAGTRTEIEQHAAQWLAQRDGGSWSDADDVALAAWLDADVAHRVAFLRLESAWDQSARLQALGAGWKQAGPPPRGHWQTSPAMPREHQAPAPDAAHAPRPQERRARVPSMLAAASLLVCAVFAGWGWQAYTQVDSVHLATILGEVETRRLGDGSQATLGSDSRLDVRLSRHERRVELHQGEAIFDVAKDPDRPFVVHAGTRQVVAVGTRFSVRRDGRGLRVVVTEGTVRLQSAGGDARKPSSLLPAGSVAQVDAGSAWLRSMAVADAEQLLEWRDGLLVFRDTSLRDAAAEFNRYNARKIVVGDEQVGALRIGGHFRWDNLDAFVRLLERGFPVRAEVDAERIMLRSP
jgi:transmembrane sensor